MPPFPMPRACLRPHPTPPHPHLTPTPPPSVGVQASGRPLHSLVLAAAEYSWEFGLSPDGLERMYATNHAAQVRSLP
jgi:hypothetical protein